MNGPGKYDPVCTVARTATEAAGVVLIVIDGNNGSGFSVQAVAPVIAELPALLREVAKGIEEGEQ